MLKHKFVCCILFFSLFIFSSCYFMDTAQNQYQQIDESTYVFYNSDAMIETLIPLINKSFTAWHWNRTKFVDRYYEYYSNVDLDEKYFEMAKLYNCPFCVYIGKGTKTFNENSETRKKFTVNGTYYLITENVNGISTIFYER